LLPESFTNIWNLVLVWPIEGALEGLASFFNGVGVPGAAGVAIIVFTMIVRTGMLPLSLQQIKSQRAMMSLQPRLRELQQRFAGDRARMGQEQIRLYKEAGVNPIAGCLPMAIQMPIWFALYSALINLSHNNPEFQTSFLWIENLSHPSAPIPDNPGTWPLVILPVLTALTQWIVQKMSTMPTTDPQQQQMNRMMEFMPFMFLMFSFQVASGLTVYWVISNLYTIAQQRFFVGWGSLPFLGSKTPPAQAAVVKSDPRNNGSETAASKPRDLQPTPARRRSSSGRRRRR